MQTNPSYHTSYKAKLRVMAVLTIFSILLLPDITQGQSISRFNPQQIISTNADSAHEVQAADLDDDGYVDIISASHADNKIAWYKNQGDGTFGIQKVISTAWISPKSIRPGDVNNDGATDLVFVSSEDSAVVWLENQGDGSFVSEYVLSSDSIAAEFAYIADINNDGFDDIITGANGGEIAWFEYQGNGSFGNKTAIDTTSGQMLSMDVAEFDGDNYADVVLVNSVYTGSYYDISVLWYKNLGGGNFGTPHTLMSGFEGVSIYATDLDKDDLQDIVLYDDANISWMENQGAGSFAESEFVTTYDGASDVMTAELDGDTFWEILTAIDTQDMVAWYDHKGGGSFGGNRTITTNAANANSVHAADLDNDGDMDVLSASYGDDKIAWYENQSELYNLIHLQDQNITLSEDDSVMFSTEILYHIPYPDTTMYSILDSAKSGEVKIRNHRITYVPELNFNGQDSMQFVATDTSSSDTAWVFFEVQPVNDPPAVKNDTVMIAKNTKEIIKPLQNDTDLDGDSLLIDRVTNGSNGTADLGYNWKRIIYDPVDGYTGKDSMKYYVTDDSNATASAKIIVEISAVPTENQAPEILLQPEISVLEDHTLKLPLAKIVVDDQDSLKNLVYHLNNVGETGAAVDSNAELFSLKPSADWWGQQEINLTVEDSEGLSTTDSTVITVIPVNDLPQANAGISNEGPVDGGYEITFADSSVDPSDPEGGIAERQWSFGDGTNNSSEVNPTHTYTTSGTYGVQLVVTDNADATDTTTLTVDITTTDIQDSDLPDTFTLKGNYPNPFNPATTIKYGLPKAAKVEIVIYDLIGRKITTLITSYQNAGWHTVQWNGTNDLGELISTGVYFYRLVAGDFVDVKKMVYMK
ncbi:MAG: FG-GAP-like repeat-containing protein [Candidatus Marinimicrobia bacterium]|nr:FG-GAP-like repeat-containing protein [Candidatus Neomarinimicrobiota bacterium]MCF7829410.1 FG-GAP-like repeat-containing protein [Candidatus Neomarinimicrobiota bacterium]MCF7880896.1 FG-GAP-like repeat-containing protein [Candidatus Neomarinimicrobiota bacterium]